MLTLLATDEFAEWFHALPDSDAEDVATQLEVLRSLSDRQSHCGSDLLLWYQALPAEVQPSSGITGLDVNDTYYGVAARIFRVLRHLESAPVLATVAQLPAERAVQVRDAIIRIKSQTRLRRLSAMMHHESEARRTLDDVECDYRAALEASGLQEPAAAVHGDSLRQLHLNDRPPGMRILYGVKWAKETVLLVLGEHLDRRAYGRSVRRALSVWEQFLASSEPAGHVASLTSRGAR